MELRAFVELVALIAASVGIAVVAVVVVVVVVAAASFVVDLIDWISSMTSHLTFATGDYVSHFVDGQTAPVEHFPHSPEGMQHFQSVE